MSVWLVRAGRHGEDENTALTNGIVLIGWSELGDLSHIDDKDELKELYRRHFPDASDGRRSSHVTQIWTFLNSIKRGDLVVLPLKQRSAIAIGRVVGDYEFLDGRHIRRVEWLGEPLPRSVFGQDLLYSLGAFSTVCGIRRNNAEERIKTIVEQGRDPFLAVDGSFVGAHVESGEELDFVNIEELAKTKIRDLISAKFKGHDFTRLIEALLRVQGYHTYMSPPGPDGGVDILAGFGPLGFDGPRLCVQVKSGGVQNDSAIRELEGVMHGLRAEQGLFVSWDGFNRTAISNAAVRFFVVRLWDDMDVIDALLRYYDELPDEIQTEIPLKRIWVPVEDD